MDNSFEFGWGFYLVILPLIATILAEIIKMNIYKIEDFVRRLKFKMKTQGAKIEKLMSWIIKRF